MSSHLRRSPRVTGLSHDAVIGYKLPFNVHTCLYWALRLAFAQPSHFLADAAILLVGSQVTYILRFFLSFNIRTARQRAWAYTVASRGKGPAFWQPYVEEWEHPPVVDESKRGYLRKWLGGWVWMFVVKRGTFDIHHNPVRRILDV